LRRSRNSPETKLKGEWAGDSTPAEPGLGSCLAVRRLR
jgi:hypothetical protein